MDSKIPPKRVLFARLPKMAGAVLFAVFVLSLWAFCLAGKTAYAVTNPTVNFQARLMSSAGAIVPDGSYNVEFKLYSASSGGTALWTEDWLNSASQGISVANGYLTASLGSINPFANATTPIPWGSSLWLTMNIGGTTTGTPGWDGEMSPRLSLTAVPSALALTSSNASGFVSTLGFSAPTANETILLPAESGATEYVCYQSDTNCGFLSSTSGVLLQATTPGTTQTGNINISGTMIAGTFNSSTGYRIAGVTELQAVGSGNIFVGNAGNGSLTGSSNVGVGASALQGDTSGYDNTALGVGALFNTTTGHDNAGFGGNSLYDNTTGLYNMAFGQNALYGNTSGSNNVGIGVSTLSSTVLSAGSGNTAIGSNAAENLGGSVDSNNTIIGYNAGNNLTTDNANNIIIGANIAGPTGGGSNYLNIGNVLFGNTSTGTATFQPTSSTTAVQVLNSTGTATITDVDTQNYRFGIDTSSPSANFQVSQSVLAPGTVTNSASSAAVTGTSTTFTTTFRVGDTFTITSTGNTCTISVITDNTHLTCASTLAGAATGSAYTTANATRFVVQNNGNVGINTTAPSYTLDVAGDINTSTAYRIGGTSICDTTGSTGCIAKSGSGYYIHNGQGSLTAQTSANFSIQGGTGVVTGILEANGADILDLQNSSAVNVATFNSTGVLTVTGAQSADITTFNAASATANGITIRPGTSGGTASSGGTVTVQAGAGAGTGAGGLLTLQGGTSGTGAAATGGNVQIQGGTAAGTGVSNGGNIILQGGTASGTGVQGQIQVKGGLLYTTTTFSSGASATITKSLVDSFTTILATATASGLTFTVPSPTLATAGRMLVISNAGATNSFILAGAGSSFTLNTGSSATLMWNGSSWTNAGVDASTLQTAYNNSIGGSTPMIQLNTTLNGVTIEANSGQLSNQNFLTLQSPTGGETIGFGVTGTYFQEPLTDGLDFQIQQSNGGVVDTTKDVFSVDTTAAASVVNLGSTNVSGYNGSTVNIVTTNNANGAVNIGSTALGGSALQTINIGYTATLNGTTNVNIGAASPGAGTTVVRGAGGLTLTGGAASTWSTSAGALTIQGFAGVTLQTPATSGASTNSSALTIQSGNATGTTSNSGNITLDVGTATGTKGTISIGSTNASNVTIGNSSGSVTLQGGGGGGVSINASINGATNINTGTSTGAVTIGNTSDTNSINITNGTGQTVVQASVIPLYLNSTSGTDQESAILYELNGTAQGEIGLTGTATKIINQTAINDLGVKSLSGNIWLAAGGNTGQVEISGTNGSVILQNSADSNAALVVKNQAGTATVFTVDTSRKQIIVGSSTSDPVGVAGAMYYNSSLGRFRCYQSIWTNCVSGVVYANTTIPAGNTVTSTTISKFTSSYTIPANDCQPGRVYTITAQGLYTTASGTSNQHIIYVYWGSTAILDSPGGSATGVNGAVTPLEWRLEAQITCVTTTTVEAQGLLTWINDLSGVGAYIENMDNTGTITVTTSSSQSLQLAGQWSLTGGSMTLRQYIVDVSGP